MRNLFVWLNILLVLALIIVPSAQAALSCNYRQSCLSGETDMLHIYSLANSHVELSSGSSYTNRLCCGGVPGLSSDCGQTGAKVIIRLSSITNSHVELGSQNNYQNPVCMHATGGDVNCGYVSGSSCTSLGSKYICLATLYSQTNSHIADCDGTNDYSNKVCCEYSDKTPPTTSINPSGTSVWVSQDAAFGLPCADIGGVCQTTYYKIVDSGQLCGSSGFIGLPSDTVRTLAAYVSCPIGSACSRKVCYYSADDSGNTEALKESAVFRVDKKPPVTTDNSDDNWHGSDVDVMLSCSEAETSCSKTYYCVYDEGVTPCSPTTEGTNVRVSCSQGSCTKIVRYYSTDSLGNAEPIKQSKTIRIDLSLPVCTVSPLNQYTSTTSISVSWSSSSVSPITEVILQQTETGQWSNLTVSSQASGTYLFSGQNGRTYSFRCIARNTNSMEGYSTEVSTMVDVQPPQGLSISAPQVTNMTEFQVGWSATDVGSGIANYTMRYRIGSGAYGLWSVFDRQTESAVFGQNSLPVALQNNNTYAFRLTVQDLAGNSIDSNETSVIVDMTRPICIITNLSAVQSSQSFTLGWAGHDGESGISEFVVEQKKGTDPWMQIYRGAETSRQINSAADGTYSFRCRSTDRAGNAGDYSTSSFTTVDISPPQAQVNFTQYVYVNNSLTIEAVVTDAIKVDSVTLVYNSQVVPMSIINSTDQTWTVSWVISNLVTAGQRQLTLTVGDSGGKSQDYTMSFTVVEDCMPGEIQSGCSCGTGLMACGSDGKWGQCLNVTKTPETEFCDGLDNDCDGVVDDVNAGTSVQSTACQCYNSNLLSATQETCNGIDDDCNALIDDNGNCCDNGATQSCGGTGLCTGLKTCSSGIWGPCVRQTQPSATETCGNSVDDNCDGRIDENCVYCTDADKDGYGDTASNQCTYPSRDCDDNDPQINPGMEEVCNGLDDNCNGEADEYLECETCSNGMQDGNEEGTDCGGDCPACFNWSWLLLTAAGVGILVALAFVWLRFRKQGRELTWEELRNKWTAMRNH